MQYQLCFNSTLGEYEIRELMRELLRLGPFADLEPERTGPNTWALNLAPQSPSVLFGYASVVEFQWRACRFVEIENVRRIEPSLLAATSW